MIAMWLLVLSIAMTGVDCLLDSDGPCSTVCYNGLGCFPTSPPYGCTKERPITALPMSPEEINPQYLLYTQENPTQYQNVNALNVSSVANTNFKANRRTFFVAHGFTDSGKSYYVVDICKALLEKSDINCFCIDYENGAAPPYTRAVNNIRVVGELVAKFIRYLNKTYNHSMSDIYMIGHSLGGQLAGEIGKRLNGLVAMISALDPAGPCFENTPPEVRIDSTDAVLVYVIHTNGLQPLVGSISFLGLGMYQAAGCVDIYPNGGGHMPGCGIISATIKSPDNISQGILAPFVCSHHCSFRYFIESIRRGGYMAYRADSYDNFTNGATFPCTNTTCIELGFISDTNITKPACGQKFYLNTGDVNNSASWRFRVKMTANVSKNVTGSLKISLCRQGQCSPLYVIYSGPINSSTQYTAFIDSSVDVPLVSVMFSWTIDFGFQYLLSIFSPPQVGASMVTTQYGPNGSMSNFCGSGTVKANTNQELRPCPA